MGADRINFQFAIGKLCRSILERSLDAFLDYNLFYEILWPLCVEKRVVVN